MNPSALHRRSLRHYWPVHLATALCAAAASIALTGSLLVGDSMRASLRDNALRRLGHVEQAMISAKFFREVLASDLAEAAEFKRRFAAATPVILARGSIQHAASAARNNRISILGVDDRFWECVSPSHAASAGSSPPPAGSVALNETLARDLDVHPGDDVLLRLGARQAAPAETLLGRTDQATVSLRLTVDRIVPNQGPGAIDLSLTQGQPRNAYIPLADLQRALKQQGRVNAILVTGHGDRPSTPADTSVLQTLLASRVTLADAGLKLRPDPRVPATVLESDSLLIEPAAETAALTAAKEINAPAIPVLTYLANTIATIPPEGPTTRGSQLPVRTAPGQPLPTESRKTYLNSQLSILNSSTLPPPLTIPYSTVTAISTGNPGPIPGLTLIDGTPAPTLQGQDILLDEWAAGDLHASAGDRVLMTWYTAEAFHHLETSSALFTVRGIVRMDSLAADPTLAPEYEGITNAKHLSDWNPPFPMDLRLIRDRDESYWDHYGPTPKAFVALPTGQQLWTAAQSRFGQLTSIRLGSAPGKDLTTTTASFERELLHRLTPQTAGLSFEPLRARALAASEGATDFGVLFLSFSMFLIGSAAMLTALLFRLGVQRRSAEIGLLLAVGFRRRQVTRNLLCEAAWPAGLGAAVGLLGAVGYSALMLAGLRTWWSGTIQADFLHLHINPLSLAIGWAASVIVALLSIAWSLRGLTRRSPRELLQGASEESAKRRVNKPARLSTILTLASTVAALLLIILSAAKRVPPMPAFFGSGAALLIAAIAALRVWTRRPHRDVIRSGGLAGIARLGIRNAARNPLRTLLTAALVASAAFVITAVGANRLQTDSSTARTSGTGGFALTAESTVPIIQDLNSSDGRRALGLSQPCQSALAASQVIPFRLRPGDEASCAGLYRPTQPRILGATQAMIRRGGFTFRSSLAQTSEEKANPWLLLNKPLPDGATPTIGDDSTVTWLLHLGLGDDLTITDDTGRPIRLRIVALLSASALQSELIIPESRFVEHFPSIGGYAFFLLETPPTEAPRLKHLLEQDLNRYALEVTPTADRLSRYLAVENAYLTAFQTLGGLGLILGTLGLGAVLWRNVLERRGELALLAALGFSRAHVRWMILSEHIAVLTWGLSAGAVAALLAVAPQIASHPRNVPWATTILTLLAVLLTGITAAVLAIIPTLRGPLPASLRNE